MFEFVRKLFGKKQVLEPKPIRKKVNTQAIINRIKIQGWNLLEIPIKKSDPDPKKRVISTWKIIATKNDRSFEISGPTKDDAINNLGKMLGVISTEN